MEKRVISTLRGFPVPASGWAWLRLALILALSFLLAASSANVHFGDDNFLGQFTEYLFKTRSTRRFADIFITVLTGVGLVWLVMQATRRKYPPLILPENLNTSLKEVFNSDDFLKILRTAIPTGKDDPEYGFDFVPWMLHSLDDRRKRFERSARRFLVLTVALGLCFCVVLAFFAYMLIDESVAGTKRDLRDIEGRIGELKRSVNILRFDLSGNEVFTLLVADKLGRLSGEEKLPQQTKDSIYRLLDIAALNALRGEEATDNERLAGLAGELRQAAGAVPPGERGGSYYQNIREALNGINEFQQERELAFDTLPKTLDEISNKVGETTGVLNKSENRVPEILKRLFLSLMLATFFIAILRYVGRLYQEHQQQVLIAEQETLALRKFYLSYKCSPNPDGQKNVVAAYMNGAARGHQIDGRTPDGKETLENTELLKDLMSLLAKKL